MSPLPYLPGGVDELPAARFILFANTQHLVQKIDESALQIDGVSFTGYWESGRLNGGEDVEATLRMITIKYISEVATTMTVDASADGGVTWGESKEVTIEAAPIGRVRRAKVPFEITGYDLRIRFELDTDSIFYLYEFFPLLIPRSEYDFGG